VRGAIALARAPASHENHRHAALDPIIGRLFVDGTTRSAFLDDGGNQYIIDQDGHTRCYGTWLPAGDSDPAADAPLVVPAPDVRP
jgi:hypothetical protein